MPRAPLTNSSEETSTFCPREHSVTDQAKPDPLPWRRFLRFSVRGTIFVALVIGLWLGCLVRSARIQREAVAVIARSDAGAVSYDWDHGAGNRCAPGRPWAPSWLVDPIGVDYFGHVRYVVLFDATPGTIVAAARLSGLRRLGINGIALCDADLAPLSRLTDLEELVLEHAPATDAGLAHLKRLSRLRKLTLVDSGITDDGLVHLKSLTSIRVLRLRFAKITDAGLAQLNDLTTITHLDLSGTQVTDAGLVRLKGLTNLSKLDLSFTQVSDAGEKEMRQSLPSLTGRSGGGGND
jgi:hypothetical protein